MAINTSRAFGSWNNKQRQQIQEGAKRLRNKRGAMGITMQMLAFKSGLTLQRLNEIDSGNRQITQADGLRLMNALDMTRTEFNELIGYAVLCLDADLEDTPLNEVEWPAEVPEGEYIMSMDPAPEPCHTAIVVVDDNGPRLPEVDDLKRFISAYQNAASENERLLNALELLGVIPQSHGAVTTAIQILNQQHEEIKSLRELVNMLRTELTTKQTQSGLETLRECYALLGHEITKMEGK